MGRTGWRRRRLPGGLDWLYIGGNRRKKESLLGIPHFSLPIYQSLPFPLPHFHTASGLTLSFFFFSTPLLDSSHCLSFSFLSRLYMSSRLSSFSVIPFIVVYLSSPPSFHFCLFVCVLTIFSLLHLFYRERAWREICASAVEIVPPYQERVGVKHRHRDSLPGRWHHIEANGCRET